MKDSPQTASVQSPNYLLQTQSEDTLLVASTDPLSFAPGSYSNSNQMSGHVQNASSAMQTHQPDVSSYAEPPQSVPYNTNPTVPMSVSPQHEFLSPHEDRSTLLQTLDQPTLPNRSDAVASTVPWSDAATLRPVKTPNKIRSESRVLCNQYSASQQCSEG